MIMNNIITHTHTHTQQFSCQLNFSTKILKNAFVFAFFLLTILFSSTSPLFAQSAQSDELPRIAVYVTGNVGDDEKNALGTQMLVALVNSGRYRGIERSAAFRAEIERELQTQRSGMIDDQQISELGRQFGVRYICIADITPAFGAFQVSARIINVETAEVVLIGAANSQLQTIDDLTNISNEVVRSMFGEVVRKRSAVEHFLAPKFMLGYSDIIDAWGFNLEYGQIRSNGLWWSVDGGTWNSTGGNGLGGSFNIGFMHEYSENGRFAYGGSVGFWMYECNPSKLSPNEAYCDNYEVNRSYVGPIVRLRWRPLEVTYRGLIGQQKEEDRRFSRVDESSIVFFHQIMFGLHFSTNRRRQ